MGQGIIMSSELTTKRKRRVRFSETSERIIFANEDSQPKPWYQKKDYERFKEDNINDVLACVETKLSGKVMDPEKHCMLGLEKYLCKRRFLWSSSCAYNAPRKSSTMKMTMQITTLPCPHVFQQGKAAR